MPMPTAYQPKKITRHHQEFFKGSIIDKTSEKTLKKNLPPHLLHHKFFIAFGLLTFLYAGLRGIEYIEKYNENPILLNNISQTLDSLKKIKTNYAYAEDTSKPKKNDVNNTVNSSTLSQEDANLKSKSKDTTNATTNINTTSTENSKENLSKGTEKKETSEALKNEDESAVFFDPLSITSPNDVKILKALGIRRQEIDKREAILAQKELELSVLEKKVTEKVNALEAISIKVSEELKELDQQEVKKVQSLAKIYSAMKPKEAARIFEGMDMPILLTVVARISERKLAPIIALLSPEKARELTKKLAHKSTSLSQPLKTN